MSFAGNYLKSIYVKRTPETNKTIHVVSSALKATLTWHNMRALQVSHPLYQVDIFRSINLIVLTDDFKLYVAAGVS